MSRREIVEIGHPVLRERAWEVTPRRASLAKRSAADRRHGRDNASRDGAGFAANQVTETRVDRGRGGEAGNLRDPYKPPIPLTVIVHPLIEPLDDEIAQINQGRLSVSGLRGELRVT